MCYARRQRSSWARIKLSSKLYLNCFAVKTLFVELVWLFLLFWVCASSVIDKASFFKEIRDSFALSFCLYFNLLLFNCQWSVRASLAQAAFCATCTLYHIPFYLSRGFSKVFSTFFVAFSHSLVPSAFWRKCLTLYHILSFLSRGFSKVFSTFSVIFRPPCSAFGLANRL